MGVPARTAETVTGVVVRGGLSGGAVLVGSPKRVVFGPVE